MVIKGKKAVEVKFSKNLIKDSKYKVFKEKYPEIPLEFLTFNDIFEKLLFKL
ncbi:MAG: hypothetical protein LBQ24_07920 [Candidatus Peribacteria bacterium]|nr:hypothetical protein [Candidatus Peribacteria bacterium]